MSVHNSSMEFEFDRPVEVGSQHAHPPIGEPLQHLGVRMPKEVPPPARDDGEPRTDGVEEGGSGGAAAAVMCDFQDVRPEVPVDELRLGLALDVPREQDSRPLDLHAQDDRRVVLR